MSISADPYELVEFIDEILRKTTRILAKVRDAISKIANEALETKLQFSVGIQDHLRPIAAVIFLEYSVDEVLEQFPRKDQCSVVELSSPGPRSLDYANPSEMRYSRFGERPAWIPNEIYYYPTRKSEDNI